MSSAGINRKLVKDAPSSLTALKRLLFDGLDWPRPAEKDIEDIPVLEWKPDELHLDPGAVARLTKIQQLPKLTDKQQFGVFILTFNGGKLPVGAVRRVVERLVRTNRASQRNAQAQWNLGDLLFFCHSTKGEKVLHVVSFTERDGRRVMKVISWTEGSTDNRIDLIATRSLPLLRWPENKIDADAWREGWRSAFTAEYREGIRSAKDLAVKMAEVAKTVRDGVSSLYEVESEAGPLRLLFREVKDNLRADLTPESFADMYAQTMVYGLLTARITHPEDFETDAIDSVLKFENPFLDELYSRFRKQGDDSFDVDEFGLHDLAELLASANMDEILADFGVEEKKDDPVVFFYEEFLEEYDPVQRRELGTYYTPIPVVRFMVRAVDEVIRTAFGLPLGVADQTTWAEYSKTRGIAIPKGVAGDDKVIRMIDPATGTGTFLLEWMRQAERNLKSSGNYSARAMKEVVGQMDAFEINLSSYAIAHLKTSLELEPSLRATANVGIRLTDTLSGRSRSQGSLFGGSAISVESEAAERVKFDETHSVVVGNPPYLRTRGEDGDESDDGDPAIGGMIRYAEGGGPGLLRDFVEPLKKKRLGRHAKNLYNLYVYFWRWAMWKLDTTSTRPVVVAFITASSYIRGPGFVAMRDAMRDGFDAWYVIDLGGEGRGANREPNVFDGVMTPVAIAFGVRGGLQAGKEMHYVKVDGTREEKLDFLTTHGLSSIRWSTVNQERGKPFLPRGEGSFAESPLLTDLFPWQHSGVQFKRTWTISPSYRTLKRRWKKIVDTSPSKRDDLFVEQAKPALDHETDDPITGVPLMPLRKVKSDADVNNRIRRYMYRSFDRQWAIADNRVCYSLRPPLWVADQERQTFLISMLTGRLGSGPAAIVSPFVPDLHAFRGSFGAKHVVPLLRSAGGEFNVDPHLVDQISEIINSPVAPADFFAYSFGVLAGTDYTSRFKDDLALTSPRVPITKTASVFAKMVSLGTQLIWIQTFGSRCRSERRQDLLVSKEIRWLVLPSRMPSSAKDFEYDASARAVVVSDGRLLGVSQEVWDFEVSGMQVIKKWLGYRTACGAGRAASSTSPLDQIRPTKWEPEWSEELREIVHVLTETLKLIPEGVKILDEIMAGELIPADDLPEPPDALRKPPIAAEDEDALEGIE